MQEVGNVRAILYFWVLRECKNNEENVVVLGFYLILCGNMDIFDGFRPSAIFYYIERLFILENMNRQITLF